MSNIRIGDRVNVTSKHNPNLSYEGKVFKVIGGWWLFYVIPDGHVHAIGASTEDWNIELIQPKIAFGPGAVIRVRPGDEVIRMADHWVYLLDNGVSRLDDAWWAERIGSTGFEILSYGVGGGVR